MDNLIDKINIGAELKTNIIYCGDNKDILATLPEKSVDLIYADPPFFSNRHYEVIWNDGAEIRAFDDRWKGGINQYVKWIRPRLRECHRVLKDTGSIYLHCDWHANAYLRILMDVIFGHGNFQNEIIWCYKGGGIATKQFKRKHDTLLFYSKSNEYTFNPPTILRGYDKFYKGGVKVKSNGKALEDWWSDIPSRGTATNAKEWIGYPTQKPESLLKRIMEASSNKGDIVLDPFCGCGTTLAVAQQLSRQWIGIDVSQTACRMIKDRLVKLGANNIIMENMPTTVEELKAISAYAFQDWVIHKINGVPQSKKSGDAGVDGWTFMEHEPVQVKQQESVGSPLMQQFQSAIRATGNKTGYFYAFSFSKPAYEEVARAETNDGITINLITIRELLEGK